MSPTINKHPVPDVSVIIVNYNAGELLQQCVASVFAAKRVLVEVIVVDNASDDDSLAQLLSVFPEQPNLQIYRNEHNTGFAKACNLGTKKATGKHILYLNPDTLVEANSIQILTTTLEQNSTAGMVGGLIVNPDGGEQAGCRRTIPTPWLALVKMLGLTRFKHLKNQYISDFSNQDKPLPKQPIAVEAISGACMLVKRQALLQVGGFDEDYFLHCEDLDWCLRFTQKGWKILFVPAAKLTHYQGSCSRSRPIFVEWHKHRGMLRFYNKFFKAQYPRLLMALVTIAVGSRFVLLACFLSVKSALVKLKT